LLQQPYFAMSFVLCLCHLLDWLLCLVGLPAAACFCLLRTVRPTERSFQLKTHLKELYPQFYTLLWYSKHFSPSRRPDYERAVWEVPSTREAQSRATHFALLQLVQRKYKWYPWAALLLKIWVAVAAITVALLGLLLLLYGAWDLAKRC